ncbi:response regulator transcription factor [Arthrobacter sp. USHLN218]|uniref:response regulator transcription factor n=1 Tax=Arthrobacter sp. USHLN218 TaxID=3081232 RepID=UPI0030191A9C
MEAPESRGIRVLLADDEALVRGGLAMLLEAEQGITVAGEAADGAEAVEQAVRIQPDVVVMDIRMPGTDGVEATRQLSSDAFLDKVDTVPAVLVLTTFGDDEAVRTALRSGASGFILKSSAPRALGDAVRALAAGGGWLDPAITRGLLADFVRRPDRRDPGSVEMAQLTKRERDVLTVAAHGLSNAEIATHLFLSEATVKTHMHRIFLKLGITDRAQAVAAAYKSGLVRSEDRL